VFEEDTGDEVLLEEQDDGQMTHDGSNDDGHARIEEVSGCMPCAVTRWRLQAVRNLPNCVLQVITCGAVCWGCLLGFGSDQSVIRHCLQMRIVPMATIAKAHNSKLHGLGESTPSSRPRSLRGIQSRNSLDSAAPHSQMHGAPDSLSLTQTW
jgi:hypothetical protein